MERENYHKYGLLTSILAYSFVTALFFYPCLGSFANSLIGPAEDNMSHLWDMWWAHKVFIDHTGSMTFSNYIFYPQGSSLLFQSFSFYNLFLSVILGRFFSLTAVYNLLIISTFVISGAGAFLLIRYLTGNTYAGLIGGFIFAFNPSHFAHSLHHIELSSIQFIPFFVLYFMKSLKENSGRNLFLACLFFFLNSVCSFYYLVLGVFFLGFAYLYLMYKRRRFILPDVFGKIALIIMPTIFILSPWLFRMAKLGLQFRAQARTVHPDIFVVDALALIMPGPYHLLSGVNILKYINAKFTGNPWELTAYLGIVNIVLIILAFKGIIKETAKYFLGLFAFLFLSMGTSIHLLGWQTPVALPYEIIRKVPLLSIMHIPSRAIVYVYLFFAIIVSFAIKYLCDNYKNRLLRKGIFSSFFILLLFSDYYSPCDIISKTYLPPAYKAIKKEGKDFGVLDLPAPVNGNITSADYVVSIYMMYQTFHGFPIVHGYISRKVGRSLIDYLEREDIARQKEQLTGCRVKYIVVHKKFMPQRDLVEGVSLYKKYYKPAYEDAENLVLQVYE